MSRIGNDPINIPEGVTVQFDNNTINVKGKLGELSQEINPAISVLIDDNTIKFSRANDQKENRSMHGLYRALVYNMVSWCFRRLYKKARAYWGWIQSNYKWSKFRFFCWILSQYCISSS